MNTGIYNHCGNLTEGKSWLLFLRSLMKEIHLVRCLDLDNSYIVCAFDNSQEAERYAEHLEAEKEEIDEFLIFYTSKVKVYTTCEEVANERNQ